MNKVPRLSAKEVTKALTKRGFEVRRIAGSHIILARENPPPKRTVVVPNYSEIPTGTLLSIIQQTGMTKEDFFAMFL